MKKKKIHQISTACPQCGCSNISHISEEELKERYGDVPNIELECHECLLQYKVPKKTDDKKENK